MFKRVKDILKVFKLILLVFVYSMPKIKKTKVKGPPKKRGRKPRKNKIDDEFKFSDDEVITNFQNNPGQGPHPDSGSDTALGTSFNTQGKSNGSDEEVHFEFN